MKVSTLLLAVVSPLVASASSNFLGGVGGIISSKQEVISQDLSVPGSNPLYFCADPADNLLTIDNVELAPNPPEA